MQLLDAGNQLVSRPSPNASVAPGWANNDVGGSAPPTIADPDCWNAIMAELSGVITAAGQSLSKTNVAQLLAALIACFSAPLKLQGVAGSAPGSAKTASWAVKEIVAKTGLGGQPFLGANLTLNFNGATTGAGGMDTGAVPSAADLSVYAIYNPTTQMWNTLGCLGSTSNGPTYGGANMPSGYTASALIWAGVTSGNDVQAFQQVDSDISIASFEVLNAGTATSWTAIALTSCVPACAKTVSGYLNVAATGGGTAGVAAIAGSSAALCQKSVAFTQVADATITAPFEGLPIATPQEIVYEVGGADQTQTVIINGYSI